ncbi:ABC transporter substrate-binding protein [Oceanitalea stevensii]|uniref:ABC transporter substrate-binding protein n=1 Tax=Oceanitalea stevensii TaxID=2763072 RepID=A0ABR8Z4Q5_9MICO|nr:ABC transporter substrate-binding protein [Oceanitalea stevensii]MBD8063288.1 ABC transporter substrate-binding protein [Oceanitalea stevensii]
MTRTTLTAAALLASALTLAACGQVEVAGPSEAADGATTAAAGEITVVDDQDREVTIAGPVERAVVALSYNNEFVEAIGAGDRVVGVDRGTVQRAPYLGLTEEDVVGESIGELNYEAIVALDPDVAIIPRNGAWQEAAERLAEFDIPVVVVTSWDVDVFEETIDLLGEVFDEPEGAQAVRDFHDEIVTAVEDAVAGTEPVPVYWETDQPYITALPGSGFDQVITGAGGTNVFGDITGGDAQHEITVDPAAVVERDPAVVVHEQPPSAEPYAAGEVDEVVAGIPARPGWSGISAVENGEVYVTNGWATSGLAKAIATAYLATWLHPEETADLDPAGYLERWATEFQGVTDYPGEDAYVTVGSAQ